MWAKPSDFIVITKMFEFHLGNSYLVKTTTLTHNKLYELRYMNKRIIYEYEEKELVFYEKNVRDRLRHHFLVNPVSVTQDISCLYLVNEMPLGGFLFNTIKYYGDLDVNQAKFYFAEIVLAVQYVHSRGFVYGHLMPQNIMLDKDGHIKLRFDYLNLAGLDEPTYTKNIQYLSLEIANEKEPNYSSDFWSLGVILYELLFGKNPFKGNSFDETITNLRNGRLRMPAMADRYMEDLIRILVNRFDFQRLKKRSDIYYIKNHKFFTNFDWEACENKHIQPPTVQVYDPKDFVEGGKVDEFILKRDKYRDTDGYATLFREWDCRTEYGLIHRMDLG